MKEGQSINLGDPMERRALTVEWALRINAPKGQNIDAAGVIATSKALEAHLIEAGTPQGSRAFELGADGQFKEI